MKRKTAWMVLVFLILAAAGLGGRALAAQTAPAGYSLEQWVPGFACVFPLDSYMQSSPYGYRTDPINGKADFHGGIDLACEEGTLVRAAAEGVVVLGWDGTTYGNHLRILHGDGTETLYAHLQYVFVRTGEDVAAGQVIGAAGQTGRTTGPHLHFEILYDSVRYDAGRWLGLAQ